MNEWAIVVGMVTFATWSVICYFKGLSDGLEKKNEDIEAMLNKAFKKSKED